MRLWDVVSGDMAFSPCATHMLKGHEDALSVLTYQHQGPLLASGSNDGLVILWAPPQQTKALCYIARSAPISQLRWLPDNQRLAAGVANGMVELFVVNG